LVAYGLLNNDLGFYYPTLYAMTYLSPQGTRAQEYVAQSMHDVVGAFPTGTLHLWRTGGQSCAEVIGLDTLCMPASAPRMHMYLWAGVANGNCAACGTADVRFSNLRLNHGQMVPP